MTNQYVRHVWSQTTGHVLLRPQDMLGSGGEGSVYRLQSHPDLVAKVYHRNKLTDDTVNKLQVMIDYPPRTEDEQTGHLFVSWPRDTVHDTRQGPIVGFLMPAVDKTNGLYDYYNPSLRRRNAPHVNYANLCSVAKSLAAALDRLHGINYTYLVGDINESNAYITENEQVTLIDADSFQVTDSRRTPPKIYRCLVGKPEYTPPELQRKSFARIDRNIHHDNFALAVVIYQLLMEGMHPFRGIYTGPGEKPQVEACISRGYFLHAERTRRQVPLRPPPASLRWDSLPERLRQLFRRCFDEGHSNPTKRPSPREWENALDEAIKNLQQCTQNPSHSYFGVRSALGSYSCTWCERKATIGIESFPHNPRARIAPQSERETEAQPPTTPPRLPPPPGTPPTGEGLDGSGGGRRKFVFWAIALAAFVSYVFYFDVFGASDLFNNLLSGDVAPLNPVPVAAPPVLLPTDTPTFTPTLTPTVTPTPTSTPTHTPTLTATLVPTATATWTQMPTSTSTATPAHTATWTPTVSATPTSTPTATPTPPPCSHHQEILVNNETNDAPYCITTDGKIGPPPWRSRSARESPTFTATPAPRIQSTHTPTTTATPHTDDSQLPTATPVPQSADAANSERCGKLQPGADLSGCNFNRQDMNKIVLTGAKLINAELNGADFEGAKLDYADLTGASLIGANLKNAILANATMENADMTGASVEGAAFDKAIGFSSANISGIESFKNAKLRRVKFAEEAQLAEVNFEGADLSHSELINANLEDANFRNATLNYSDLMGANLIGATLNRAKVERINLDGANLQEAKINGVDFTDFSFVNPPIFIGADLRNSTFFRAVLNGINFSGTRLDEANFDRAEMTSAVFDDAELEDASMKDAELNGASFRNSILVSVDFSEAEVNHVRFNGSDLESAKFSEADLTGADFSGAKNVYEATFRDTVCSDGVESDNCYDEGRLRGLRP